VLLLTGTQNVRYSRRVLEYSLRYSLSTRVTNYSDSTALVSTCHLHLAPTIVHSCSNNGVIQLGPLSFDAMFEVVNIIDSCFVHLLLQDAPHAVVFQLV